jgi:hypothetical protein
LWKYPNERDQIRRLPRRALPEGRSEARLWSGNWHPDDAAALVAKISDSMQSAPLYECSERSIVSKSNLSVPYSF